jgi:preprotein translocase subunit SecF
MFTIVKHRYWYFALSLLVIAPGVIALAVWGLPLAIDFTGGTLMEIQFSQLAQPLEPARLRQVYTEQGFPDSTVQTSGADIAVVRSKELTEADKQSILAALSEVYGPYTLLEAATVGPSVGAEVATRAAGALGLAAVGILLYISFAFRRLGWAQAFRYGACAIIAMLHDVLVVLGAAAIFGKVFGWEVDALFLTALLTVASFSVHDTIVVFDRIRENLAVHRRLDFETVVNHSIVQTLDRSINTQFTVMLTLLALALFGGDTLRHFVVTLLIGVFSGTYSSIFNAAPLLVVWENGEWNLFRRRSPATA